LSHLTLIITLSLARPCWRSGYCFSGVCLCVCVCRSAQKLLESWAFYQQACVVVNVPSSVSSFPTPTSRCSFPAGSDVDGQNAGELFYRLSAFGRDFHFNLTRNDRLMSPSLVVEFWSRDGTVRRPAEVTSRRCHYVGHISTEETTSSVAFSNCFALVGCLAFLALDAREKSKVIDDGEFLFAIALFLWWWLYFAYIKQNWFLVISMSPVVNP